MHEKSKKKCYFQSTSLFFNILHTVFVNNIKKGQNYNNTKLDRHTNGLAYALQTMVGSPLCWTVGFTEKETVRSKLATEAIKRMVKK